MADQEQKDRFVAALTELDVSPVSNGRLRDALGWDKATYTAVKDALVADGVVTPGRGRGGSVSLSAGAKPKTEQAPRAETRAKPNRGNGNGGELGFETELFRAADKLRGNMEPSDYKHVVLGLIFLKHISDSFEAKRAALLADYPEGAEDPDEYAAQNVFWVCQSARGPWIGAQIHAETHQKSD
jgi:type I restriction enzyme M protein